MEAWLNTTVHARWISSAINGKIINIGISWPCATMSSQNPAPASSSAAQPADDELEKLLSREASAFQREVEVERILKAFKLK